MNGFLSGGIASGFDSALSSVGNFEYQQGLLQAAKRREQQAEQNRQQDQYMQSYNDFMKSITTTADSVKIGLQKDFPHLSEADISKKVNQQLGPMLKHAKDMFSVGFNHFGMKDQAAIMDMQLTNIINSPSSVTTEGALARAKEGPLAQEEKKARIDYLKAGTPKPFGMSQNPDAPGLPGNDTALGTPATFNQRFAQNASSTTDVGADVGEQAGQQYLTKNVAPQDRDLVASIANYDTDPQTAASGRVPRGMERSVRQQLIEQAMAYAKAKGETYTPRAFKVVQDFLGNGKHGDTVRSLNVITEHLGTLRQLGQALDNGDVQTFNSIAQRWAKEFGQSAPTNFEAAKTIIGTELIKALGVANAGTADERADLGKNISVAASGKQINDAINQVYGPLLTGQLKGLRNQYLSAGGPREKFDKVLLPGTKEFIDKPTEQKTKKSTGDWGELKVIGE